jgi:hypothetical protein
MLGFLSNLFTPSTCAGFISIDCGIAENSSYPDSNAGGLRYVSDAGFVDAGEGVNALVQPPYLDQGLADRYRNVRYFPTNGGAAARNCYTLLPVIPGGRYLVRGSFYYGNYDGRNERPAFDLHLGVNRWATVNVTAADTVYILEAVAVSPADFLQVSCLPNLVSSTPYVVCHHLCSPDVLEKRFKLLQQRSSCNL